MLENMSIGLLVFKLESTSNKPIDINRTICYSTHMNEKPLIEELDEIQWGQYTITKTRFNNNNQSSIAYKIWSPPQGKRQLLKSIGVEHTLEEAIQRAEQHKRKSRENKRAAAKRKKQKNSHG
jgi:hypothetical protein